MAVLQLTTACAQLSESLFVDAVEDEIDPMESEMERMK